MAYYLIQGSYTSEAWAAMVENPQNRMEVNRQLVEKIGATIVDSWLTVGESDFVVLLST
ncbi:MAG: GYD domain-containing protein [Xenococcaceae cyanobacterium]